MKKFLMTIFLFFLMVQAISMNAEMTNGVLEISINVEDALNNPTLSGFAELVDGIFEDSATGALYKNIYAKIELEDGKVFFKQLEATDLHQGTISGTGVIELDPDRDFPMEFDLVITNTRLVQLDALQTLGDGHLKIKGNSKGVSVTGKVVAHQVAFVIPKKSAEAIHHVEVLYINQSAEESKPIPIEIVKTHWPIALDITVETDSPISIKGPNLESIWKGELQVKGTVDHPLLYGELKIRKGEYLFRSKEFKINEGTISFAGEVDKKTSLYVIASREIEDIRADVILKGTIHAPAISFRSNPPLSQREIVSWILFGHGISDLSSFQGSQLNESITNLNTGGDAPPDILSKIKDRIGIDKIDVNRSGENNEVSLKIGKYVSKGILISIDKSITAEANRVSVEADVIKNIKVQAEVGDDSAGQLRLKWKKDY